jgi:DNA-directed RNA polymerase subunit RPC12/RpoP
VGALANHPLVHTAEIEIACHHCGYRMMRTADSLRHEATIDCPACGETIRSGTAPNKEKP